MQAFIVPLIVFLLWIGFSFWYVCYRVGSESFGKHCNAFLIRSSCGVIAASRSLTFRVGLGSLALAFFVVGLGTLWHRNLTAVSILWSAMLICMIFIARLARQHRAHYVARKATVPEYPVAEWERHLTDALGFLKDWVTAIIQIETALLGGIGAAFILKIESGNAAASGREISLTVFDKSSLVLTALAFGYSIVYGVNILNMLPGAAQRTPPPGYETYDVYNISPIGGWKIEDATKLFRQWFFVGLGGIAAFVLSRVAGPGLGAWIACCIVRCVEFSDSITSW